MTGSQADAKAIQACGRQGTITDWLGTAYIFFPDRTVYILIRDEDGQLLMMPTGLH